MTIEFYGISFVCECDHCSNTLDTDKDRDDGFMAAVEVVKREGWSITKTKLGDWQHICPVCQDDEDEDDFDEG